MSREIPTEELIRTFSYKGINDTATHENEIYLGNFFAARNEQEGSHDYIDFMCTGVRNENTGNSDRENIYITIDDRKKENMENAWNAILPVLIKHQVYATRVVREGSRYAQNIALPKCGQQIVLRRYCDHDRSASRWNKILTDITQELIEANVTPGPITQSGGYQILSSFCLRKEVAIPTNQNDSKQALEDLEVIAVDNQPPQNIISTTQFNSAARSLKPSTLRSNGTLPNLRKSIFLSGKNTPTEDPLLNSSAGEKAPSLSLTASQND